MCTCDVLTEISVSVTVAPGTISTTPWSVVALGTGLAQIPSIALITGITKQVALP